MQKRRSVEGEGGGIGRIASAVMNCMRCRLFCATKYTLLHTVNERWANCTREPNDEVSCCYFCVLHVKPNAAAQRSALAAVEGDCVGRFDAASVTRFQLDRCVATVFLQYRFIDCGNDGVKLTI